MSAGFSRKKLNQNGSISIAAPLVLAFVGLLFIAALINGLITRQKRPPIEICAKNLRLIDHAKDRWSLENRAKPLSRITERDLMGRADMPSCPSGGKYFLNLVGLPVQCSIEGHVLSFTDSCRWNINSLNNAASSWLNANPQAKGIDFFPKDVIGYSKALKVMPVCHENGKYIFNSDTCTFQCSLGTHD